MVDGVPGEERSDRQSTVGRVEEASPGRRPPHGLFGSLQLLVVDEVGLVEDDEIGQADLRRRERELLVVPLFE